MMMHPAVWIILLLLSLAMAEDEAMVVLVVGPARKD